MTVLLAEPDEEIVYGNLRWSSVRDCPRKAIYESQGAPARERTRQEEGYLWRGRQLGRDFAIILAAEERRKGNPYRIKVASGIVGDWPRRWVTPSIDEAAFLVEEPVPWPLGILHPDIRVLATDTIVEVLSSATASEQMTRSKTLQLVGQMEFTGATAGAVVVVNPSQPLDYDILPLARSSATYGQLVDEMHARIEQVREWRRTLELPARVCAKPSEARGHFCLYAEHCFTGWEPPDPDVILQDPAAQERALLLYEAKRGERAAKEGYDRAVALRREYEQEIHDLTAEWDGARTFRIGPVEITRVVVSPRETFSLKKARDAGLWTHAHDELFGSFLSVGGGYTRLSVDRARDAAADDFGDEAPW